MQPRYQWQAEALWQRLEPLLPGLSVEVVARIASTNTELIDRARSHAGRREDDEAPRRGEPGGRGGSLGRRATDTQPCLLVAEQQTRGRGRQGRTWHADPGSSLTFSLALPLTPADWSGLSLAVGLALAEALEPLAGQPEGATPRLGLKWPNDLMLRSQPGEAPRKLGGILIETVTVGASRLAVVGVGLNLGPQPAGEFSTGMAHLGELGLAATDPPAVLARVAEPLVRALIAFEREGFAPLVAAYARRDLLAGQRVTTTLADLADGVAEGVDASGALRVRVRTDGGDAVRLVSSGDVSVRLDG